MTDKLIVLGIFAVFFFGWYSIVDQTFEVNPKYNFSNVRFAFGESE